MSLPFLEARELPAASATTGRNLHALPAHAWALGGRSHFPPHNPNYPGNFQAAAFPPRNRLKIRIWSPGATKRGEATHRRSAEARFLPLRSRGGKQQNLSVECFTRPRGCAGSLQQPVELSAATTNSHFFPDICPPKAITSTKKRPRNASDIVNISTWALECFHMPPHISGKLAVMTPGLRVITAGLPHVITRRNPCLLY